MACVHRRRSTASSRDQQEKDEGRSRPAKGDRVTHSRSVTPKSSKGTTGGWVVRVHIPCVRCAVPTMVDGRTWYTGMGDLFFSRRSQRRQVRADRDARVNAACVRAGTGPRSLSSASPRAPVRRGEHMRKNSRAHTCVQRRSACGSVH